MPPSPAKNSPGSTYNEEAMIKRILITVAILMVLTLVALWLWLGGVTKIITFVRGMSNPIEFFAGGDGSYVITLPGAPAMPRGADISAITGGYDASSDPESQLEELQDRYDALKQEADDAKSFGEPSPYRGKVTLSAADARESAASREYLVIEASGWNGDDIPLAGWSVQSMLTNARVLIPNSATAHLLGAVNPVAPVMLPPGGSIVLATGASPAGVSFRENRCTGYLEQMQHFEPALANACPSPREALPLNAMNIRQYGEACIEYVDALPPCQFVDRVPSSLPVSCQLFVANTFSYNGCVATYRRERDFNLDSWRLYLGLGVEQWRNTHDIIRLVDADGRTVDSITY